MATTGSISGADVTIRKSPYSEPEVVSGSVILGGTWVVGESGVANTSDTWVRAENGVNGGTWTVNDEARVVVTGGNIKNGWWTVNSQAEVAVDTGNITGGTWALDGGDVEVTLGDVINGAWTVKSLSNLDVVAGDIDGGTYNVDGGTVSAEKAFPASITLDAGTVTVDNFGDANDATHLKLKGGASLFAQVSALHNSGSVIEYEGISAYGVSGDMTIDGDVTGRVWNGAGRVALTVLGNLELGADLSGNQSDWDVTGVKLKMIDQSTTTTKEVVSPDVGAVIFSDSECVKYWRYFEVADGGAAEVQLVDVTNNETTMTGAAAEAMYVNGDVMVANSAQLDLNGFNLYYTGTLTNNGTIQTN